MKNIRPSLPWLLIFTLLNFAAQIPYYLYLYYFPRHLSPGMRSIALMSVTLGWFLVGYIGTVKKSRLGYAILLSFLLVEALFYASAVLSGAFIFQLHNARLIMRAVYAYGYVSGACAALYAYLLVRDRRALLSRS